MYGFALAKVQDPSIADTLKLGLFDEIPKFKLVDKVNIMANVVHRSHITITREMGPTRRAVIEGFAEPVFYGVHGGIKDFYKVDPEKEHAATLDHIVGAVGG